MKKNDAPKKLKKESGAFLLDVVIASFFLFTITLTLATLIPTVRRAQVMSSQQSKAIQMVDRLIEHVQMLPARDITGDNLIALNLIERNQTTQPWSFTHIPLDEASRYSPAQVLKDAKGTMTTTTLPGGSVQVMVNLSYTSASGKTATIQTGTVVGSFR